MEEKKLQLIAGVDEAGRGPLAGPVYAAAVILNPKAQIRGLKDSKLLLPKQREALFEKIKMKALAWSFGRAEVEEIDQINILKATLLAMQRAVSGLMLNPELVLIDGNQMPSLNYPAKTIIDGDQTEKCISAASIVAKVLRDQEMIRLDTHFPQYGFAQHKGYGTRQHLIALKKYGPCSIHRRYFHPVAQHELLFEEA